MSGTTTNLAVCCSLRLYNILIGSSVLINKPPPRYNYLFSFETSLEQSINPLFLLFKDMSISIEIHRHFSLAG